MGKRERQRRTRGQVREAEDRSEASVNFIDICLEVDGKQEDTRDAGFGRL